MESARSSRGYPSRGGVHESKAFLRAAATRKKRRKQRNPASYLLCFGALAVACGWSYHAIGERTDPEPAVLTAVPEATCQTVVFFRVPKTGGESVNELWSNPWWKDSYTVQRFRRTRSSTTTQENELKNM